MARIKGAMMTRKRRNKVLKAAKGYWGAKSSISRWQSKPFSRAETMHLPVER